MPGAARGSAAIWVTLALALLLGVLATVLNAGHVTSVKGELNNGVDAAALAGAIELSGRTEEIGPTDLVARATASEHYTDKPGATQIAADQVILGEWRSAARAGCDGADVATAFHDSAGGHFCEVRARDAAAALRINAVYTRARRAAGSPGGGPVPVFLAPFLGRTAGATVDQAAEAIALTGGPCSSSCLNVPMVVGVGCLGGSDGAVCDPGAPRDSPGPMYVLGLSSTSVRSTGWSVFSSDPTSESNICSFFRSSGGGCAPVELGTSIQVDVGQGNKFNGGCRGGPGVNQICDWFKGKVGRAIEVPVISTSGSVSEACPSTYTGTAWVVGFSTFRVLAVNCSSNPGHPDCVGSPYCTDSAAPCSQYASGKCVLAQLVCNHQSGARSTGCAWTGTSTFQPVLVQTRGSSN